MPFILKDTGVGIPRKALVLETTMDHRMPGCPRLIEITRGLGFVGLEGSELVHTLLPHSAVL